MPQAPIAPLEVTLDWESPHARHRDRYYYPRANLWHDDFPADLGEQLQQLHAGETASVDIPADDWLAEYQKRLIRTMRRDQFRRRSKHPVHQVEPRTGRFYPRRFIHGVEENDNGNDWPLRCLRAGEQELLIDFNHPMAGRRLHMQATLLQAPQPDSSSGGAANDVLSSCAANGPGMQASLPDTDTDFFTEQAFRRIDEAVDSEFYASPRLVQHLDTTCREHIQRFYARFLQPGMRVLDLMSSWVSHLPEEPTDLDVHGLGLNAEELQANPRLRGYTLQDLNQDPRLPFDDAAFDIVICTASIEYLIAPLAVTEEIARVLRPGAPLVITFSDRWFPTKAIQLWTVLYDFERMQLVLDYLRLSGRFGKLASESLRGYPRPADDPYIGQLEYSDPVFGITGIKKF